MVVFVSERDGGREGVSGRDSCGLEFGKRTKEEGLALRPHWCMKIIGVSRAYNFWLERGEKKKKNRS